MTSGRLTSVSLASSACSRVGTLGGRRRRTGLLCGLARGEPWAAWPRRRRGVAGLAPARGTRRLALGAPSASPSGTDDDPGAGRGCRRSARRAASRSGPVALRSPVGRRRFAHGRIDGRVRQRRGPRPARPRRTRRAARPRIPRWPSVGRPPDPRAAGIASDVEPVAARCRPAVARAGSAPSRRPVRLIELVEDPT